MAYTPAPDVERAVARALARPIKCTEIATRRVCALICEGYKLFEIAERPGMPTLATLTGWINHEPSFRDAYHRARLTQSEVFADRVVALAEELTIRDHAGLKLRIDAHKWHVALIRRDAAAAPQSTGVDDEMIRRLEEAHDRACRLAQERAAAQETDRSDAPADSDTDADSGADTDEDTR